MIRKAQETDAIEFTMLVKQFVKEAKYPFKVDPELVIGNFKAVVNDEDFFVYVSEEDADLVGFLVGAINAPLFSSDQTAVELGWFMVPEYRNGKDGLRLLTKFEAWAKDNNCRHVTMVDIDPLNDLDDLYSRKGYELTEKAYVKEI